MPNNWYVITGAPSSGKSTIVNKLASLGYETMNEWGRKVIDREMTNGKTLEQINVDSPEFERSWVEQQVNAEKNLIADKTTFFDRGILDTLAYFHYYKWPIPGAIKKWCDSANYNRRVFLTELMEYKKDYARIETEDTARQMQQIFIDVYEEAGYDVILIPKDTVENRLKLILDHVNA